MKTTDTWAPDIIPSFYLLGSRESSTEWIDLSTRTLTDVRPLLEYKPTAETAGWGPIYLSPSASRAVEALRLTGSEPLPGSPLPRLEESA